LRSLLLRFIVTSVAILAVAKLLPGIEVHSLFALIMTVVILGILNVFLRPIMIFITLPFTVVTLGLFLFIINGIILYLVSLLIDGFEISSLFVAIIASVLITIVSGVINWLAKE